MTVGLKIGCFILVGAGGDIVFVASLRFHDFSAMNSAVKSSIERKQWMFSQANAKGSFSSSRTVDELPWTITDDKHCRHLIN